MNELGGEILRIPDHAETVLPDVPFAQFTDNDHEKQEKLLKSNAIRVKQSFSLNI